jgi:hypothetical protein
MYQYSLRSYKIDTARNNNSVVPCIKPKTLKFEKIETMLRVSADQVAITSQIRNSAYSELRVTAPCSNYFQSSAFRA